MRFLSTLCGNESNRDVFGVLRGRCSACDKCERFAPDLSQGQGWNSVKQLECANCHCSHTAHVQHKDETEVTALDETTGVARTFSERAVLRCSDSLADFVRGYLPLHGLQEEAWRLLPLLLWLEASVYTLDETNEDSISDPSVGQCDESPVWKSVRAELQRAGLLDGRVEAELAEGGRYWRLERAICRGVLELKESDVERCATLKSFDYRLLHAVALRQCGMRAEEPLLEALRCYEALIETRDDVSDWAEDEARGSFNVLLQLARLHGRASARAALLSRVARVEGRYAAALARLPPPLRARHEHYVRTEKGGAWLWDSIVPRLEREPPRARPASASAAAPLPSNEPVWRLCDARKAVAVLRHAWTVSAGLLGLPPALPILGPVIAAALRAARPRASAAAASQLEADGSRYLRGLATLSAVITPEEVWRLCRWRAFDTLLVAEALAAVHLVPMTDTLRALLLALDMQVCLAADWDEFKFTTVRDESGRATLGSLAEDPRQLNAALLLHKRASGAGNVEQLIRAQMEENHRDALLLLRELAQPRLSEAYAAARAQLLPG